MHDSQLFTVLVMLVGMSAASLPLADDLAGLFIGDSSITPKLPGASANFTITPPIVGVPCGQVLERFITAQLPANGAALSPNCQTAYNALSSRPWQRIDQDSPTKVVSIQWLCTPPPAFAAFDPTIGHQATKVILNSASMIGDGTTLSAGGLVMMQQDETPAAVLDVSVDLMPETEADGIVHPHFTTIRCS